MNSQNQEQRPVLRGNLSIQLVNDEKPQFGGRFSFGGNGIPFLHSQGTNTNKAGERLKKT